MSTTIWAAVVAVALLGCAPIEPAPTPPQAAAVQTLTIETHIVGDPQAGMKSRQTVKIDFDRRVVTTDFVTGVTDIGVTSLNSIRDRFTVKTVVIDGQRADLRISGETASGVGFMPNIDYSFNVEIRRDGSGRVSGCHDGYPGYEMRRGDRTVYAFVHEPTRLDRLFGDCDIQISPRTF
jgi:Protein of unknown function (DUF3238).